MLLQVQALIHILQQVGIPTSSASDVQKLCQTFATDWSRAEN